jgi:hypothetical protein
MPVIGRLDGQVDEIIIKPISGRLREEESPTPPEDAGTPENPDPPDRAPAQTPHPDESSAEPDELPVWLL